ncbi:MAG: NAD(P)-dependent oxidoreductase [Candidatus Acidiferrales bacterium]|jgi:putative NADH-flavin reductase
MKKIMLIGSSGMIGQRILHEALNRGHHVTALVRETSGTGEHRAELDYHTGDIFKPDTIAKAAVDHDVVVSAYGPGKGDPNLVLKVAHALIEALTRVEPIRLIAVSGAGSLEVKPGLQLVDAPDFPAEWKAIALAHREALEVYRKAGMAEFDWTAVSPAALISPGTRTGKYRTGTDQLLVDDKGKSYISAEDFAVAIVDEIEKPQFQGQRFTVAY